MTGTSSLLEAPPVERSPGGADLVEIVDALTRREFIRIGGGVFLVTASGALLACSPDAGGDAPGTATPTNTPAASTPTPAPVRRRMRLGSSFAVANLDPLKAGFWMTSYGVAQTLFRVDREDQPQPWIAKSLDRETDGTWVLKLDPNAKFHSGRPINAAAVKSCIEVLATKSSRQVAALKGATYETPDATTLRIKTSAPDPWLKHYFASQYWPMWDLQETPDGTDTAAYAGKAIYSGPFKVTSLSPQQMVLDEVASHWEGAPKLLGVDVKFVTDANARLAALKSGEIDLLMFVPTQAIPEIKANKELHFKSTPGAVRVWVMFNHKRPILADPAVRRAVSLAVDRKQLASLFNDAYEPGETMFPPAPSTVAGLLQSDAAEARKVLDAAGWVPGADGIRAKGGQRLSFKWLHYPQQPDTKTISEAIQAQLKAVGIAIELQQVDDIVAAFKSKNFDAGVRYLAMQEAGNPMSVLNSYFRTTGPLNDGSGGSAELDGLIAKLGSEFSPSARADLMKQMQQQFAKDLPVTFVLGSGWMTVANDAYSNYVPGQHVHTYMVGTQTAPKQ
jgi:peptide/nickel transport system substrate-binding protein